jgi:hypothetical protein
MRFCRIPENRNREIQNGDDFSVDHDDGTIAGPVDSDSSP